ncbi:hypothetical protein [Dietzia sp.]|uniref:hypothetical protein n=1 Tax=Dietzia sp. TaxID=1871616 RepID=UPI002FD9F52F
MNTLSQLRKVRNALATRAQVSQPVLTGKVLAKLTGGSSSKKAAPEDRFDPAGSAIAQANSVAGPLNFPVAAAVNRTDGILAARRAAAPAAPGASASRRIDFSAGSESAETGSAQSESAETESAQ